MARSTRHLEQLKSELLWQPSYVPELISSPPTSQPSSSTLGSQRHYSCRSAPAARDEHRLRAELLLDLREDFKRELRMATHEVLQQLRQRRPPDTPRPAAAGVAGGVPDRGDLYMTHLYTQL